jgi:WD40 repeat protein
MTPLPVGRVARHGPRCRVRARRLGRWERPRALEARGARGPRSGAGAPATEKGVRLLEVATGKTRIDLRSEEPIWDLAFSPDGKRLGACGQAKDVLVWDVATGAIRRRLVGHTASVGSVAFSPDGATLATASRDTTILIWDLR